MEADTRFSREMELLNDPSSVFNRPPRARSRSPLRSSDRRRAVPVAEPDELIEDFVPLTEADLRFGVKEERQPPLDLQELNNLLRQRRSDVKPKELLAFLLAQEEIQKQLKQTGFILALNDTETEFILYPDPASQPPPAPPVAPVTGNKNAATLGFGFPVDLRSHAMRVALYFNQAVVKFAVTVAGQLSAGPVSSILETGFEDLVSLARKASLNQQDREALTSAGLGGGGAAGTLPAFQAGNWQAVFSERELQILEQLRGMTDILGDSHAALSAYNYLNGRRERNEQLYGEWMTLPMNMSQTYFKPFVQAGIDIALAKLDGQIAVPRNELFYTLINSDARAPFAQLVAAMVKKNQASKPNTGTTGLQFEEIRRLERSAELMLQKCTYKVDLLPTERESPIERGISFQPLPVVPRVSTRKAVDYAFF